MANFYSITCKEGFCNISCSSLLLEFSFLVIFCVISIFLYSAFTVPVPKCVYKYISKKEERSIPSNANRYTDAKDTTKAMDATKTPSQDPEIVIFSGGTAFNSLVKQFVEELSSRLSFVLPISDNGGSTREIIRVLGGPAIGDIRSRLIRLASSKTEECRAIKHLLEHRLTTSSRAAAKKELLEILEGIHPLWKQYNKETKKLSIREPYKQTVRSFLVHFFDACLRKSSIQEIDFDDDALWCQQNNPSSHQNYKNDKNRNDSNNPSNDVEVQVEDNMYHHHTSEEFDFRGGSIGNFVFTGARLFFHSLEAAIFWFSNLTSIPHTCQVLPILSVNNKVTIAAKLQDGSSILGQNNISHPYHRVQSSSTHKDTGGSQTSMEDRLPSVISKIVYVNQYGAEIAPPANPAVIQSLESCQCVVRY